MLLVDAHLDLAYNALRGRQITRSAAEQKSDDEGTPSVGLPDLRAGGASLICGTIFCEPDYKNIGKGYRTPEEASAMAYAQLRWYQQQFSAAELTLITRADQIETGTGAVSSPGRETGTGAVSSPYAGHPIPTILLMEGADPIGGPDDVPSWFDAGVRIVGLAWKRTRYSGGTADPGPLTPEGRELVAALDAAGIIHDVSHLAEESFWQLLDRSPGPIMASHSNCRAIIPTDRQLSDEMIRALLQRGGIIGVNFYDKFLIPPEEYGHRRANFDDVIRQIRHICDLAGDTLHVGIGTDMDGGFGRERLPREIATWADLPRLAEAMTRAGFSNMQIQQVMGTNWIRFLKTALPR